VRVSDHAIVRYLERVVAFDIDAIREEMRAVVIRGEIGSERLVVEDGCIVTVLDEGMRPMSEKRAKKRRECANTPSSDQPHQSS